MIRYTIICLSLLTLTACKPSDAEKTSRAGKARNVLPLPDVENPTDTLNVAFLIMDGVFNTELTAPMDIFQHTIYHTENGMRVFTIAKSLDAVRTFEGLRILPDFSYADSFPSIDVLVVPSAEHHLDTDLEDMDMIAFVREVGKNARYVTSHCDGAFVLAQAGLLDSVACTTFPSDIPKFRARFPHLDVRDKVVFVHDGRSITSAGGARSFDAALYLVELLYGKKVADGCASGMVIDWDVQKVASAIER
jgi:transcriptional regulator GlxA family with amidase domain